MSTLENVKSAENTQQAVLTKLHAEAREDLRKPVCKNALSSPAELAAFGKGVVVGGVNGAEGFIQFMSTSNSVNDAMLSMASCVGTAGAYYSEKTVRGKIKDIVNDAGVAVNSIGGSIEQFSHKTAEQQGATCGELAFNVLLGEAGIGSAKAMLGTTKAAFEPKALNLYSKSEDFDSLGGVPKAEDGAEAASEGLFNHRSCKTLRTKHLVPAQTFVASCSLSYTPICLHPAARARYQISF